jgi:hypothetical protein
MQKLALFWIRIGNLGKLLLQIVHIDTHKGKQLNISPGGNVKISTIPMGVKHTQNMAFFVLMGWLGRVGCLMVPPPQIADLGFSE